jgi:protein-S-isoprenylcysteine O-methyltransferase Ste14
MPDKIPTILFATPVVPIKTGTAQYTVSFDAPRQGVLVFDQAYDSRWRFNAEGRKFLPASPVMALTNGFVVPAGHYTGSVGFAGRQLTAIGAGVGLLAVLLIGLICFMLFRMQAWRDQLVDEECARRGIVKVVNLEIDPDVEPSALGTFARWPLYVGIALLGLGTLGTAFGNGDGADLLAVGSTFVMLIAVAMVIKGAGRRREARLQPEPPPPIQRQHYDNQNEQRHARHVTRPYKVPASVGDR